MAEAERLLQSVAAEGKQYQSKRHEMVLARAKHEHEDKLHKNKAELLQTAINEKENAQEQLEEELKLEKEILESPFARMDEEVPGRAR